MPTCKQVQSPTAALPCSNRWMALRQSLRDLCEGGTANWWLRSGVHLHKGTFCSFQVLRFASLRTKGDTKQQWHLWQVMIPSPKIWIMTYLDHLLQLKSLLLIPSSTCVLQQHVPGAVWAAWSCLCRTASAGAEPAGAELDEMLSAFICCIHKLGCMLSEIRRCNIL